MCQISKSNPPSHMQHASRRFKIPHPNYCVPALTMFYQITNEYKTVSVALVFHSSREHFDKKLVKQRS